MQEERRLNKTARETAHNLILENRKKLSVSGVNDVESFDEESIVLYTDMGTLTIKGSELHIQKLSVESGETVIEGRVDSCVYSESGSRKGGGFLAKLFK